jgi:hypothetical protein
MKLGSKMRTAGQIVLAAGLAMGTASAQIGEGCALDKQVYTCNRVEFASAWKNAGTVTIEASPRDKMAASQLREMAGKMGKSVGESGELTVLVVPRDAGGVDVGPAGVELGSLRVYAPSEGGRRGNLVWAETYTGQPDMSWPAVVHALVAQFEQKFKR